MSAINFKNQWFEPGMVTRVRVGAEGWLAAGAWDTSNTQEEAGEYQNSL